MQNEIVAEYKGEFVSSADFNQRTLEADRTGNCFFFEFFFQNKKCAIDAKVEDGSKGRLINHSRRSPNVKPIVRSTRKGLPVLLFKALRKIHRGDEVLYDYNERRGYVIQTYPWLQD